MRGKGDTADFLTKGRYGSVDNHTLYIAGIEPESIVDGPGYRYTIFTQGCPHNCPGCHNPKTHPLEGGTKVEISQLFAEVAAKPVLRGVTFSGGEPFLQAKPLAALAECVHSIGKTVITYSGYTYEYLCEHATEENGWAALLAETDFLIDGPYVEEQASLEIKFRGSRNQRIIDIKRTRQSGSVVCAEI